MELTGMMGLGTGHDLQCTIGSNRHLDKCGRAAGLDKFVNRNRNTKGIVPKGTMSATVEALIGAVFIDSGESLQAVKGAITGLGLLDEVEGEDSEDGVELLKGKMSGLAFRDI
jgi:hypothetical protein